MPTLTPAVTRKWIERLIEIEGACAATQRAAALLPEDTWIQVYNAKNNAILMREHLLQLAVVAIEVEPA